MRGGTFRIGIVAPASRIEPATAERMTARAAALYGSKVELFFHPQCFFSNGHFAGDDEERANAFLDVANDAAFDALWWARGGYGANRIAELVLPYLDNDARKKTYLGYSDAGFLLAGLYKAGFPSVVHGPVVADISRADGEHAVDRALKFLVARDPATLEPSVGDGAPQAAFNMTILSHLIGTNLEPDLADHVVMLEEVSEYMYRIDRTLFHITSHPGMGKVAGIKLGRCSAIPENDPDFGQTEVEVVEHWCAVSGISFVGRADIGHDVENKIVPFGRWTPPAA